MVSLEVDDVHLTYRVRRKPSLAFREWWSSSTPTGGVIRSVGRNRHVTALDGVSFKLKAGDRLGLLGPNGAGKTTLLKVLYGIYQPTSGSVSISGRVDALFNINLGFRREASGRRNIELRGLVNGWSRKEIADRMGEIIAFSEMGEFIDLPFKSYSQGMAARLAFSIATCFEPEILLMDEWIGTGDERFQQKTRERMADLTNRAGIVILASHNGNLIKRTCNKTIKLAQGKVVDFNEYT